jgi:hypothetical protein
MGDSPAALEIMDDDDDLKQRRVDCGKHGRSAKFSNKRLIRMPWVDNPTAKAIPSASEG